MRGRLRVRRGGKIDDSRMYWSHRVARRQGPLDRLLARPRRPARRAGLPGRANEAYIAMHARRTWADAAARRDPLGLRPRRGARRARADRRRARSSTTRARCRPSHRPRRTSRARRSRQRAAFSLTSSTRSTSAPAGSRPCASRPASRASARSRPGCAPAGPWTAAELHAIETAEVAATFGQDPAHELMALYTRALRELGDRITVEYFGRFLGLVNSAEGSAERLAETLSHWPTWRDISPYEGGPVPFYKRAQIAAADLHLSGVAPAEDLDRLTLFADNLVPHVLRLDGVLEFDDGSWAGSTPASCSSTTRPRRSRSAPARCTRSSCWPRPPGPQRDDHRQRAVEPRRAAALQGAAAPPGAHAPPTRRREPRCRAGRSRGGPCRSGSRSRRRCWSRSSSRSAS